MSKHKTNTEMSDVTTKESVSFTSLRSDVTISNRSYCKNGQVIINLLVVFSGTIPTGNTIEVAQVDSDYVPSVAGTALSVAFNYQSADRIIKAAFINASGVITYSTDGTFSSTSSGMYFGGTYFI